MTVKPNAWQFPKNPVNAPAQPEPVKSDRVDRSKEQLWKTRKVKLSKGMQKLIADLDETSEEWGRDAHLCEADYKIKEKRDQIRNELEHKVAYLQEENRRMKACMAEMGLRFDIYPIKL